ncbi:hypothetical protein I6N96_15265 [Enterococcus sp. BWM-S5]|uniref:SMI1/KNR4 family protein n=1 Tax=Enterococcus larvae TaxID=2794352 RepID=A0ABS4CM23_9ENTE|nr:hypothetical protein [Enterococcus larvae]MBP1047646.1 hypothetical protein [Enterococcus larvae]
MNTAIKNRIVALGGDYHFGGSTLESDLRGIDLPKSYLIKGFEDFLQDTMYEKLAEGQPVLDAEISYPRMHFQKRLFTPFKKGTDDHTEFGDLDESMIREVVGKESLEFMIVGETDSFPNFYFVCLSDQDRENPVLYSTDHECFFEEITVEGTLQDFFHLLVSEEDYCEVVNQLTAVLQAEKEQ